MAESTDKTPEWMLRLENKKKRPHRLAHEIGAGSPCFSCGDACPGLDLHFWRKLCRNCKCKKEEHDVKDDEGYEQFEILLGGSSRKRKPGGVLKIKVPDDKKREEPSPKGVPFDWVPPNVSDDVAADYMRQLPAAKLPISGSDGALHRRQQLEKQVPLHDLDASKCHNLSPGEIEELKKYLDNLKSNVVGQGCVLRLSAPYTESRLFTRGPAQLHSTSEVRALTSSQSADSVRTLPPIPPAYNSVPRPFQPQSTTTVWDEFPPPPLPDSLPPNLDLKTPSAFIPHWTGPQQGVWTMTKEDQDIAHSIEVPGQLSTIHPGQYCEDISILGAQFSAGEGSHPLEGYVDTYTCPKGIAHSAAGARTLPSWSSNSAAPQGEMERAGVFPVDGVLTSRLYPKGVAHSSAAPGHTPDMSVTLGQKVPGAQDGVLTSRLYPKGVAHSSAAPGHAPDMSVTLGQKGPGAQDGTLSGIQYPNTIAYSTSVSGQAPTGASCQLPVDGVVTSSLQPNDLASSHSVGTDAMPKLAHIMQINPSAFVDTAGKDLCPKMAELLVTEDQENEIDRRFCPFCQLPIQLGEVVVLADRAGEQKAWHPQCFVCTTCKELLVDLIYFFHLGDVYCGRHYSEIIKIPRCFACDELIFMKEYTMAENKPFHVKHFCCYECDDPLAGKRYVLVKDQPVCLDCFDSIYGKKCHTCKKSIAAGDQRIGLKDFNWHVQGDCFRCFECAKSLVGSRFVMKENQPFCCKECALAGVAKMKGS